MSPNPKFQSPADPADRLPKTLRKILDKWLASTDTVNLICRDAGHWWPPTFTAGDTYGTTREGSYAIRQECQRRVAGHGCRIGRVRYVGQRTGWLDKGNTYDYSKSKLYMVPADLGTWSGARDVRGIVRLEIKRRADAGEDTTSEEVSS